MISLAKRDPDSLREHLDSLPLWPHFQQDTSSIDGLVPSCRVESWERFIEVVRDPEHRRASREMIYRGQRGCDWPLASTLGRQFNDGSIPPKKRQWLLEQFELSMRGRGFDLSAFGVGDGEIEKWAIGQHHGLYTPLLDWTRSPFVALFFAFNRIDDPSLNPSRAVYCLNMTALKDEFSGDMLFREPRGYNNTRLVNQAGLFTLTPSGEDNIAAFIIDRLMEEEIISSEPVTRTLAGVDGSTEERLAEYEVSDDLAAQIKQYIFKIHIPNVDRVGCLDMLRKMNIHNGSLFPDAQGASLYCNDWLERLLEEERQETRAREERKFVPVSRVDIDAGGDRIIQVKAILDQLIPEQSEEMRLNAAQKLDYRFESEASVDWQKSPAKTARVRTRLRQIMGLIEVPEDRRDQALSELMSFYSSLAR
ncbi:FRG domain-containing protein [Ensifer sp. OTU672]|uniref:FRG domain-containing protein n=1 Tax=Ensifer sp. OTU672 TaxID=3043861 RepID=UPI00313B90BD